MVRQVRILTATTAATLLLSTVSSNAQVLYGRAPPNIKEYLDKLVTSYADFVTGFDDKFLILKDGTKYKISDNKTKTFDELLEKPDIDDMFYIPYPAGTMPKQPAMNSDPGRVRFGPLFVAMYGDCKLNGVVKKLKTIEWLPKHGGGRVSITAINGVDRALEAVSKELDELPDDLIKYLKPTSGTYNCRKVAGSEVRSMHGYGAAIDINTKYSDYWRWASDVGTDPKWRNRIPVEIVSVFEKRGFIWGGYWYHYDTMHFEYRPELLSAKEAANN
jgi:D-alanyl-D-alanine carboxypeptidase